MVGTPWPEEFVTKVKDLAEMGYSAGQIAHEIGGITRNVIVGIGHRNKFHFHGTSSRPPMVTQSRPRPPRPYVAVEVAPDVYEPSPGVTLMELAHDDCRGPIGEPSSPDFRYCGRKQVDGYPYCAAHCRLYYQPR